MSFNNHDHVPVGGKCPLLTVLWSTLLRHGDMLHIPAAHVPEAMERQRDGGHVLL